MKTALFALLLAGATVGTTFAATVDASLIPDGTYTAKVTKVVDAKHVDVVLSNGMEATLATTRSNVDFSKVKNSDQIKMSLIKGQVAVYAVQ